jgi:hypothetical protein
LSSDYKSIPINREGEKASRPNNDELKKMRFIRTFDLKAAGLPPLPLVLFLIPATMVTFLGISSALLVAAIQRSVGSHLQSINQVVNQPSNHRVNHPIRRRTSSEWINQHNPFRLPMGWPIEVLK